MQRLFPSTQSANGTSFYGHTIRTSFNEIRKAFPGMEVGDADKSRYHMVFELLDGSVVTLYDYKEWGIQDDSIVDFHIGGHEEIVTAEAQRILKSMVVNYIITEDDLEAERADLFISSVNFLADEEC